MQAHAKSQNGVPLSEYGKLPEVERAAISPSGDRIALITTAKGERVVYAVKDQTTPIGAFKIGDLKVRYIRWIGEEQILLVSSQTENLPSNFVDDKAEFYIGQILPIAPGREGAIVFANKQKLLDTIVGDYGLRKIGDDYFGYYGAIELRKGGRSKSRFGYTFEHGRPFLYRVDLETMKTTKIAPSANEGMSRDWLIGMDGEIAYTLDKNLASGEWRISNAAGKTVARGQDAGGGVDLEGLSFDGTSAIYSARQPDGDYAWLEIGQDGAEPRPFLPDTDWDRLIFDRQNGRLLGYSIGENDTERLVFRDEDMSRKAERVRRAFKQYEAGPVSWTSDLSDVIVRASGNGESGTYFAVDLETNRANALAYERTAITPDKVGPISTFQYTAGDGLDLDGILTLPPSKEPTNLPVIVMPHGGPQSYDAPNFDWWAQALASRGYAVFQPNFRGSTHRDAAFVRAGDGEWGGKMLSDMTDGLEALAASGVVDADRACIMGASYGGYAALAGVTIQQGFYKCAVAVAPVSDVRDLYNQRLRSSGRVRTRRESLRRWLGEPDTWEAISPLKLAERADAPVMLIHGVDDLVVQYSHSVNMADKLKDAGKTFELVKLKGEDHFLSLSETRQQMLENAVRWVEAHNPPD